MINYPEHQGCVNKRSALKIIKALASLLLLLTQTGANEWNGDNEMSTISENITVKTADRIKSVAKDEDTSMPTVPWITGFILMLVALGFVVGVKAYQHKFSWDYGLDSASPEFQVYWMRLFYIQILTIFPAGGLFGVYLWFSRDKNIQNLAPKVELGRFYAIFGVLTALSLVIVAAAGLLTEADAAWHQVVIRDTDFTPTHIFLFYLALPLGFVGLAIAWIWVHTRLPYFANRVSLPFSMLIGGFMMVLPVVAFNEWGHTFFYAEELFSSPVHWFFVLFGFAFIFVAGFVLQCMDRMRELTQVVSAEKMEQSMRA